MENAANDPNLHWDGNRWLRWDGQVWRDANTGAPIGNAQTPTGPVHTQGSFAASALYRSGKSPIGGVEGQMLMTAGQPESQLQFTSNSGEVLFSGPLSSFHSLALADWNTSIELWQGTDSHRVCLESGGPMVGYLMGAINGNHNSKARQWQAALQPYVGSPPAGVKVKKPMGPAGYWLIGAGIIIAAFVLATALVLLTK